MIMANESNGKVNYTKLIMAICCIALYIILINLPTPAGLPVTGQKSLALMITAIVAWTFEVVPMGISSALFVMIMPVLGIVPMPVAMATFAIPTVFFILASFCYAGGFIGTGLGYRVGLIRAC